MVGIHPSEKMANNYFQFKQFLVKQQMAAMKVTTDACLFGAWAAQNLSGRADAKKILDIGAGTGLLSLMIAQQTTAMIDAIEIDQDAFIQSMENFQGSPWKERLNILHGDIREAGLMQGYDVIVSNPPFYENDLTGASRQKNIAHHDQGLLLKELVGIIHTLLHPEGHFYLLLPFRRLDDLRSLCSSAGLWIHRLCKVRQSTGHDFFRIMIEAAKTKATITEEEIAIRDAGNAYTGRFISLLKPYYLYL